MRLARLVAASICALLPGAPLVAGAVRGSVKVSSAAEAERTVVYIETAPERPEAAKPVRLSQRGARFTPMLLAIVKGTTVDFTNDDWLTHSVFSKSAVKSFDLGLYGKGQGKSVTFERPGVVEIFCVIHPRMNGAILVLQNSYFTKPSVTGAYSLGEVPPGVYDLKVYRLGGQASSRKITVASSGGVVDF